MVSEALAHDVFACLMRYLAFLIPVAAALLAFHLFSRVSREVFRKMLHVAAFTSTPLVMSIAGDGGSAWLVAVLTLVAVGLVVWPVLAVAERLPWFSDILVERRPHEIRRSMLLFFWGNAAVVSLCWGLFGSSAIAATSILMWGFGDAAAALVGKRWGRHKTGLALADPNKTWEGSGAMLLTSAVVGLLVSYAYGLLTGLGTSAAILIAATIGAGVELITKRGYDTVTVPFSIAAVLLLARLLW